MKKIIPILTLALCATAVMNAKISFETINDFIIVTHAPEKGGSLEYTRAFKPAEIRKIESDATTSGVELRDVTVTLYSSKETETEQSMKVRFYDLSKDDKDKLLQTLLTFKGS